MQGRKIGFPIYFEKERPPTAGVPEGVIEKQVFVTDIQRFNRDATLPHQFVDDSPWYLPQPGTLWLGARGYVTAMARAMAIGL